MTKFNKTSIMETTPKLALIPIVLATIFFIADSLTAGLICFAVGGIIVVGGLLLSANTLHSAVSRMIVTLGVILFGGGIGIAFFSNNALYGLFALFTGIAYFVWAIRRAANDDEEKVKSVVILVSSALVAALLITGGLRVISGRPIFNSRDRSSSCGHASCKENGPFYCMGKNDTCKNRTNCAYDLYCDECD